MSGTPRYCATVMILGASCWVVPARAKRRSCISSRNSRDNVIEVQPESLALAYISNSTILQFVHDLGVNLNIFFRLLWRHVFTVEILSRVRQWRGPVFE